MSSIQFTDTVGAATLESVVPDPGSRFQNWTPDVVEIADREVEFGSGISHQFAFRTDYVVSFQVPYLTTHEFTVALRLKRHLLGGGTCTVNTEDNASRSYTCRLQPGTVPGVELVDRRLMEYAMSLQLLNTAAAVMLCDYGNPALS